MIGVAAHNITSPLGRTSEECYNAIMAGQSGLKEGLRPWKGLEEPICASMFAERNFYTSASLRLKHDITRFELLAISSIAAALSEAPDVDPSSPSTIFILSTTKGNVELLEANPDDSRVPLSHSAKVISETFGNPNTPIVVSNACISGVAAQITAARLLQSQLYDTAIVVGAELLSHFIVAGFQSFKALSDKPCAPYQSRRRGLNLGEGAATLILTTKPGLKTRYITGSITNDANHISGPSRTGEGSYRALMSVLKNIEAKDIAFINAHGTATQYNDEMESIAVNRAGLQQIPVNSLKPFFGHTLGAAGVIETIISILALEKRSLIKIPDFNLPGTSMSLNINDSSFKPDANCFIKLISGFGGVNGALAYERRVRP